MSINDRILKNQQEIDKILNRLLRSTERELLNNYQLSSKKVSNIINKLYERLPKLTQEQIDKGMQLTEAKLSGDYQKALNSIKSEIKKLTGRTFSLIETAVLSSYALSYYGEGWALEQPTSLNFGFQEIPESKLNSIRYSKKYKKTWKTRNASNNSQMFSKIEDDLTQGLTSGEGVLKTARNIRNRFVEFDVINKKTRVSGGFTDARRIARTETHRVLNQGRTDAFRFAEKSAKNLGVELRRVLQATLDNRTRSQSAQMDGQVADKNGFFTYPNGVKSDTPGNTGVPKYDINDRETTRTELFDENGDALIAAPQDLTFKDWADGQGMAKNKFGEKLFT